MSDPSDEGWFTADDDCGWNELEDADRFLPPDPAAAGDQDLLAAQFARDVERMRHEPMDVPDDAPPELTAEDFAQEILDGGADTAALLLGTLEPGPRAAALLAMLKPASLSPASMVSVIAATEKLASWVQARQHRWLATFACPGVAATVEDLRAYASQPGQPLSPRKSPAKDRKCQDDELASSGSALYGAPDVSTVLNETAMRVAAAEVGAALHFSPIAAQRRVCQAMEFAVDLPGTLTALEEGSIDRGRSLTIADRTQNLPVELRRRVEQAVLPKAMTRTPGQLRGIVDRAVISVDPAAAKKRHEKAVAERNVTHRAAEDGMGVFRAELAADKAQLAYSVIDQLAYQLKQTNVSACDPRGIGALRADVFSDLIDQLASTGTVTIRSTVRRRARENRAAPGQASSKSASGPTRGPCRPGDDAGLTADAGQTASDAVGPAVDADQTASDAAGPAADAGQTAGDPPSDTVNGSGLFIASGGTKNGARCPGTHMGTHQGRVTHLNVTIAASTLAGLDERPGDLDGHGPIPADLARAIAASASTIAAIAIKPGCGSGLDLGRTVYRPRLAQRDHVTIRDQTCRFPGCRRQAKRCQIDHSDEFCPGERDGGVTCPCNLQCLCVFHHGLKTSGLWDSVQHSDASVTWTSPTGRSYSTQPRQWPTDSDDAAINSAVDGESSSLNAADENDSDAFAGTPGDSAFMASELPGRSVGSNPNAGNLRAPDNDSVNDSPQDPVVDLPPF